MNMIREAADSVVVGVLLGAILMMCGVVAVIWVLAMRDKKCQH